MCYIQICWDGFFFLVSGIFISLLTGGGAPGRLTVDESLLSLGFPLTLPPLIPLSNHWKVLWYINNIIPIGLVPSLGWMILGGNFFTRSTSNPSTLFLCISLGWSLLIDTLPATSSVFGVMLMLASGGTYLLHLETSSNNLC